MTSVKEGDIVRIGQGKVQWRVVTFWWRYPESFEVRTPRPARIAALESPTGRRTCVNINRLTIQEES